MKRIIIDEKELRRVIRKKIMEQVSNGEQEEEQKPRCLTNNTMPLDEIVGSVKDANSYSPGVYKRQNGVNSFVDTLGILNNISSEIKTITTKLQVIVIKQWIKLLNYTKNTNTEQNWLKILNVF